MENALASIGQEELRNMAAEEKNVDVSCQFCNTKYVFSPRELLALIREKDEKIEN